ncbi:MAG: lipopolysaccharide transport periplasmic protein LptA [Burkholderiales bacterium]|nr:lipopolysaccharide transport periplasmic protein LptA [Burkholderiales bacterium]
MNHPFPQLLLCVVCALGAGMASAEKADKNKPMNIESDALRYDDLKQTSVFTGNVVLTKGTIVIRGARVDVRQDPEGYQFGVATAEPGKRAFFRQKREGVDEYIEGEGETIEYDGKTDIVKFIKKAEMRRLRGATLADETTGDIVVYDNNTDVFTVDGGAPKGTTGGRGRVRTMLTPKQDKATAPAVPERGPTLRTTTTLGEEKK